MTIRDILVHVPATGETGPAIDLAAELARRLGARLSALYTIRRLLVMTALFGDRSPVFKDAARQEYARAQRVEQELRNRLGAGGLAVGWQVGEGDAAALVCRAGRLHDLVVVAQSSPASDEIGFDVPERAVYHSGCPTLIVPRESPVISIAEHVAVFWDGRRETALAIRSALPILSSARRVIVIAVPETVSPDILKPAPVDILAYLSGHGIRAELEHIDPERSRGAGTVFDSAARHGTDLLVTGAPEHAAVPVRMVRRGWSGRLLQGSPLPVLLAY